MNSSWVKTKLLNKSSFLHIEKNTIKYKKTSYERKKIKMEKITSVEQFEQAKQGEKVVFQFSADWCPDCRFLDMFFQEIIDENKDFTFYYVDRDKFIEICQDLDIYGIPSFVAFNKGEEIGRYVNKDRKTKEQVEEFLAGLRG